MKHKLKKSKSSQIYHVGLEYAFLSKDLEPLTPVAYCKDFTNDVVWGTLHKKRASIYGFSYDPATDPPLDLKKTRFVLREEKIKNFNNYAKNLASFLNQAEKAFGMDEFSKVEGDTEDDVLLIEGSSRWQNHPALLSLYTLFLRVGLTCEGDWMEHVDNGVAGKAKLVGSNDQSYLSSCVSTIKRLAEKGLDEFPTDLKANYPAAADIHTIHNGGIVAWSRNKK